MKKHLLNFIFGSLIVSMNSIAVAEAPGGGPVTKLPAGGGSTAVGDCKVTAQGQTTTWNGKTKLWCEEKAQEMGGKFKWQCKKNC